MRRSGKIVDLGENVWVIMNKKMQDDIWTGRKIVISYDDSYVPYYLSVTLEESKANLRKLVETMKKEEQCGRMRTKV